ncbi:MAG: hypothetical protein IT447_16715 [Phycisphaerales bacterium]|nr:hypothetical protein [Phycisphaerales bacterium]
MTSGDGLLIGQWVFNLVVTLALAYIGAKNRQVEKLQDEIKMSAKTEIRLQLEPLRQTIDAMVRRMKDGEELFGRMGEKDHQVELKMVNQLSELKDSIRDCYATRSDVANLAAAVDKLSVRFDGMQRLIARAVEGGRHE